MYLFCLLLPLQSGDNKISGMVRSTKYSDTRKKLLLLRKLEVTEPWFWPWSPWKWCRGQKWVSSSHLQVGRALLPVVIHTDVGNIQQEPANMFFLSNLFSSPQTVPMPLPEGLKIWQDYEKCLKGQETVTFFSEADKTLSTLPFIHPSLLLYF